MIADSISSLTKWFILLGPPVAFILGLAIQGPRKSFFLTCLPGFFAAVWWYPIVKEAMAQSKLGIVTGYGFGMVLILYAICSGVLSIVAAFVGSWLRNKFFLRRIPEHEKIN